MMFWDYTEQRIVHQSVKSLSFKMVQEKLQRNGYEDPDRWAYDMRFVLANVVNSTSGSSLRNAAGKQLLRDFEEEMSVLSPTLSPHILKLQYTEKHFKDYLVRITPPVPEMVEVTEAPAAEMTKIIDEDVVDVERLSNDIAALCSPSLILRIAAFIYNCQPEAIALGNELSIVFSLMTDETLKSLRVYVSKLMYNAVTGKINPFVRSPGVFDIQPTVMRS